VESDPDGLWTKLGILSRAAMKKDEIEEFWSRQKVLSPASVVRVLFHEDVLSIIRRELNREAPARLDMDDVFKAVRDVLSKESLADAGDLGIRKKRKRRRKVQRTDAATGAVVTEEVEEDAPEGEHVAPPMATLVPHYEGMTDADLDAIVAYLFAQKPVKHVVPPRELDPATRARLGE